MTLSPIIAATAIVYMTGFLIAAVYDMIRAPVGKASSTFWAFCIFWPVWVFIRVVNDAVKIAAGRHK